jgi:hypothetical protein
MVIRKTLEYHLFTSHLRDQGAPKTYRSDHIRTEIHVNMSITDHT